MSVASLEEMSRDALVGFFSACCYECSIGGDLKKLRQVVACMKEDLGPRIPSHLAADIYSRILEKYNWPNEKRVLDIIMEVIMDRKMIGLKCLSSNLESLDFHQLSRIHLLQELVLTTRLVHLTGLHLGDLRKLSYRMYCTDFDLKVIGQSCARLEYLDISHSDKVTDVGLRALSPCTNLSSVAVSRCHVSLSGINDLLTINGNIRKLSAWNNADDEGFDCSKPSAFSVYPSIESFVFARRSSFNNLRESLVVMDKFPNLRSVKIYGYLEENLSVLGSLSQLSELDLSCNRDCPWDNLQAILISFGAMVKKLLFRSTANLDNVQQQLNFIQEFCGDLEFLKFVYEVSENEKLLLIPPFQKLKILVLRNHTKLHTDLLDFSHLPALERLVVRPTEITAETIESRICDKTKCPRLKYLDILEVPSHDYARYMMRSIRERGTPNLIISYSILRRHNHCPRNNWSMGEHYCTYMSQTRVFDYSPPDFLLDDTNPYFLRLS